MSEVLSMWRFSVLAVGINVKAMMQQMAETCLKCKSLKGIC